MTEILERIRTADNLPSLPAVALRVLELADRDSVSVREMAAVLEQDPALAVKLLRVANSPLFRTKCRAASIPQAIVQLGMRTVRLLTLSFSFVESFRQVSECVFDFTWFWRRSITSAVAARLLAQRLDPAQADEVFACALLANIGKLAANACIPDLYARVIARRADSGEHIVLAERAILGTTHGEIGATLLGHWGFPLRFCELVRAHHHQWEPSDIDEADLESAPADLRIVATAALITDAYSGEIPYDRMVSVQDLLVRHFNCTIESAEELLAAVDDLVRETAHSLELNVGQTLSLAEIKSLTLEMAHQAGAATAPPRCDARPQANRRGRHIDGVPTREELAADPASRDPLTGLPNRAAFEHAMNDALRALERASRPVSLVLANITDLRRINAEHGDRAGDKVLVEVAALLLHSVRAHDLVGRISGVEFAVLCPGADTRAARIIAERIQSTIEGKRFAVPGGSLRVYAAVGVASYETATGPCPTVSKLINAADANLQRDRNRSHDRRAAGNTVLSRP